MRFLFFTLSCLVVYSSFGQGTKLDSLFLFIKDHTEEDTIRVDALNEISDQYQWTDFYLSLHYAEESLKLAERLHFNKGVATANYRMSHCYWALGDSKLAIELGLMAASIGEKENSDIILGESYQVLARAYLDQNEILIAQTYINKAEKIAQKLNDWNLMVRAYNLAGVIEFIDHRVDSALLLYHKALSLAEKHKTSRLHLARIVSNIGECYFKNNEDLGFQYCYRALSIARETGYNRAAEAGISCVIGTALIKKEKFQEAENYLQSALKLSQQLGLKRVVKHAFAGLVDLKIKEKKSTEALAYMKSYYEVRDYLLNVSKTRQIVELEAHNEIEKKQLAIQLLEHETRIQNIWRYILITALILVTASLAMTYFLQRYRENKNHQILNLEIDYLSTQHKEISEKYQDAFLQGIEKPLEKPIESHDQRLLKRAIEIVENNITDPLFGVEKLALEMGMSRTNMHRKIKAISGFPPSELIRSIRLRRAATLLANKVDSVSQISLMVGFEDHSYFSKSFKKHFGVAPSEYLSSMSPKDRPKNEDRLSFIKNGQLVSS